MQNTPGQTDKDSHGMISIILDPVPKTADRCLPSPSVPTLTIASPAVRDASRDLRLTLPGSSSHPAAPRPPPQTDEAPPQLPGRGSWISDRKSLLVRKTWSTKIQRVTRCALVDTGLSAHT